MDGAIAAIFEARTAAVGERLGRAGVQVAYLFGSVAQGVERPDSDLDLAVFYGPGVPPARRDALHLELLTDLVRLTHVNDIDLVVLDHAPPLLRFRVVSTGRCILGSQHDRVAFEVWAIRSYIDSRPLRAHLHRALIRRIDARDARAEGSGRW